MPKGKISDIVIDSDTVQGDLALGDGKKTRFLTSRVDDPDLVKDLQKYNMKFSGSTKVSYSKALSPGFFRSP